MKEMKKVILITGAAGFIGSNLAKNILQKDSEVQVIGIDNLNDYYDVSLKEYRLKELENWDHFSFHKGNIADRSFLEQIFQKWEPEIVVNLAAQAGVRYSITNPDAYIESNILGFYNILECCRHSYDDGKPGVKLWIYASSSSIYGLNKEVPYRTEDKTDKPVSLYAATKNPMNSLPTHIASCIGFLARDCVSLRYTALAEDRTWRISDLQIRW